MAKRVAASQQAELPIMDCSFCGFIFPANPKCNWPKEDESTKHAVVCGGCGAQGPRFISVRECVVAWNEIQSKGKTTDAYNAISGASSIYEFALWIGEIQKKIKTINQVLIDQKMRAAVDEFTKELDRTGKSMTEYIGTWEKMNAWNETVLNIKKSRKAGK